MKVEFTTDLEEVHAYTKEYAKKFDGQPIADVAKAMTLDIYAATTCMAAAGLYGMLKDIVANMGTLAGEAIAARALTQVAEAQKMGEPPTATPQ